MIKKLAFDPFPLTMTGAWIVGLFSLTTAPLQDLWRPLVLALSATVLLFALVRIMSRGNRTALIVIAGAWLVLIGAWPFAIPIVAITAWRVGVSQLRAARGANPLSTAGDVQVARILNTLGAAALVVAGVSLWTSGAIGVEVSTHQGPVASVPADRPDIYLIVLDGYPATETLMADFDYDNRAFERALTIRGFDVAAASRSNYNRTLLTLASMLHMDYVDSVPTLAEPAAGFAPQTRQLTAAINGAPAPRWAADAGYRLVAISSSYGEAALTHGAQVIKSGDLTLFEVMLLRNAPARNLLPSPFSEFVAEQHRRGVEGTLAAVSEIAASRSDQPVLALAHVFSPHPPFVWNADGSSVELPSCYPDSCALTAPDIDRSGLSREMYRDRLTSQIEHLNGLILDTMDSLIAHDPDGVVVLFSDHGARYEHGMSAEHFETMFAARTPHRDAVFPDDISPVNLWPILFNTYFETDLPLREYRAAWASDETPLEAAPLPSALAQP